MVRVVLAAGLVLLAGWSFHAVFAEPTPTLLLAMAAPAIIAAGWGCAATAFGNRMLGAGGTFGAVALVVGAVALITRPGKDFAAGPARLLTGVLPADADPPQVAAVSALVGMAALVAVRLAVRGRSSLLPLLPALVCLLLGLGLGAAVSALPRWYVPAFLLLAVIVVHWDRLPRATTLAVVAIAALAGFAATPWTIRAPARLQDVAEAQVQPRQHVNPMDQYLALRNGEVELELAAKGASVDRLSMITLTDFDQDGWTSGTNYRQAGRRFPVDGQHREVTLDLRVLTPHTVGWLPRPGRPSRIDVAGLGFDAATGDITVPAGTATPTAYRITGTDEPKELSPDDTPVTVGASLPMRLPPELLGFVDRATAGQKSERDKFAALSEAFANPLFHYESSKTKATGGDGVYQIIKLLKSYRGTSEQYASAFAVMCRHLGWDARVVLGFQLKWNGDEARIKGEDVFAWTEVRFAHQGWTPINPSPEQFAPSDSPTEPDQRPTAQFPEVRPPDHPAPPEPDASVVDDAAALGGSAASPARGWSGAALVLLVPPLVKAVRRRRDRTAGSPRRRITRAWLDLLSTLRFAGHDVGDRPTTGQVLAATDTALGTHGASLASLVDRALFAVDHLEDDDAALAWQCADTLRAELCAGLPWWRRVVYFLDPRPLLPRRRPRVYAVRTSTT